MKSNILYPRNVIQVFLLLILSLFLASPLVFLLEKETDDLGGLILFTALFSSFLGIAYLINAKKKNKISFNFKIANFPLFLKLIPALLLFEFGINLPFSTYLRYVLEGNNLVLTSPSYYLIIGSLLVAPILEELVFRGIIFEGLQNKYSPKVAILISALIFSLFHISIPMLPHSLIMGIFLGWVYFKTGSIMNTILLHSITNLSVLSGGYIIRQVNNNNINFLYGEYSNLIIAFLVVLFFVYLYYIKKRI